MCGVSFNLLMINLIRMRHSLGGRWNDRACNTPTQQIVCASSVDKTISDVYIFATSGASFALMIFLSMLLLTQKRFLQRNLRKVREIEKLQLKYMDIEKEDSNYA